MPNIYDLIIVGGGPAGITAGIYGARQKIDILLITKSFGGQITRKATAIENYPGFEEISGQELVKRFESQLRKQKIDIETTEVTKIEKEGNFFLVWTASQKKFQAKTVIIASGTCPKQLKIPGEDEFIGRGVSYCTTCDGPVFLNKIVAVIGGGDSGFEAATFLTKYAKKVYILECGEKIGADMINQEKAKKTGKIEIITNVSSREIRGKKFVNSLIYQDAKTGQQKELSLEGVFVEIGYRPATSFAKGLVDFNEKGEIKVDPETYQTKTAGLFAAGDVNVGKVKQIVTACAEGAVAALAAYQYLQTQIKT